MDAKKSNLAQLDDVMGRIAKQHDRMRAFMQLSDDLMCEAHESGYFVWLNDRWQEYLGWTKQELLDRPWLEFVHVDDVPQTIEAAERMRQADLINFTNRYRTKDGKYKTLSWKCLKWNGGGTTICIAKVKE